MRRKVILSIIAVILLLLFGIFYCAEALIVTGVILTILLFYYIFSRKSQGNNKEEKIKKTGSTVDELTAEYGQPEDVIIMNATLANEVNGVILAYKDFFIIGGRRIYKSDIKDVTFYNSSDPWAPREYQVVIVTKKPHKEIININVGNDAKWASDITIQLNRNLNR
ncbi:MAG: hypothetical protein IKZ61_11185 [Prevotella sp.]|nr:hypothetical protein [Prevotella sp.]